MARKHKYHGVMVACSYNIGTRVERVRHKSDALLIVEMMKKAGVECGIMTYPRTKGTSRWTTKAEQRRLGLRGLSSRRKVR
jgi:hypothetical protein